MSNYEMTSRFKSLLVDIAGELYTARQRFFQENFENYVQDTYLVIGEGYYCWPLEKDGFFQGYDSLTPQEQSVIDKLVDAGFETVGVGRSRIAMIPPDTSEFVVKFGRCGFTEHYGNGRIDNLIEYCISRANHNLPILPSLYCATNGEYAVYPKASCIKTNHSSRSESISADIMERIVNIFPMIDGQEIVSEDNLCEWRRRYRTLDYCAIFDHQSPIGVPSHIGQSRIIKEVDKQRKAGEKRDLAPDGGYKTG